MARNRTLSCRSILAAMAVVSLFNLPALAYGPSGKPGSGFFSTGDRIVLNVPIQTAGGSRIYIQGGEVKSRGDVRESDPYCYFSLYRSAAVIKTPASIDPDAFNVSKASNHYELVQSGAAPYRVALGGLFSQDDSEKTLLTRIRLSSDAQPQVVGLHCGIWAVASERNHVSLTEIKKVLGEVVTLQLAKE